jgi:hypothetical protein
LLRYEGDYARRDLAGLEFVSGHNEQAWAALTPRLALSESVALWTSALVGQRQQGLSVKQVREWLTRSDCGHAKIEGVDIGLIYLSRYAMDDRVPTSDDVAQLADIGSQSPELGAHVAARAMLQQLAFADRIEPQSLNAIQDQIHRSSWVRRPSLKPLYAWVVGRSGVKNDPSLQTLDGATLESDFDGLLAKAILLGLAGNPTEAVRYLRSARVELGYLGFGTPSMDDEMRSAPYTLALVDYLLYHQTRDVAYRDEALRVAQTYQRIFPFLGWTYALSAALTPDKAVRTLSACRAVFLDPESQFLKLSGLKPVRGAGTCQRPLFARG